jgi:class 3 adenylate cyclase
LHLVAVTILHTAISGFERWSVKRDPRDVVKLLENLFGAFDKLAERQGIYKIESSGDSYIAVCGAPQERQDHALRMARFATDCRDRSVEIMHNLDFELGLGTTNLYLRFGLASGPVAGGILRGRRARFQLFGHTALTASLMER